MNIYITLRGIKDCDLLALCLFYKKKQAQIFREMIISYVRNTTLNINIPYSQICFDEEYVLESLKEQRIHIVINDNEYPDVCTYLSGIKKLFITSFVRNIIRYYIFPNIDFFYLSNKHLARPHDLRSTPQPSLMNAGMLNPYTGQLPINQVPYPMNMYMAMASPAPIQKPEEKVKKPAKSKPVSNVPAPEIIEPSVAPLNRPDIGESESIISSDTLPLVKDHTEISDVKNQNSSENVKLETEKADITNNNVISAVHETSTDVDEDLVPTEAEALPADFGNLFAMVQSQYS